ncbi:DUF5994 family protein [Nocardioides bruguierae]|uniref:DUF5994 family protein n=1 Tax=Nocardioides bruguierae TaxID=2945102 RepID=UPI0027E1E8DC|nr:DUF5994 family protein [Nocardioides bruguierae]
MSASGSSYPFRASDPLGHLRLRVKPPCVAAEADGVWLPYGRDLTREAAHLVDEFPSTRGRVDRVVYAPGDWSVVSDEVWTRYGRVKVGYMTAARGRALVLVRLTSGEVLKIRVAWPGAAVLRLVR